MGAEGATGWMNRLWKLKFIIVLGLAVAILAAATYFYSGQASDRAAELDLKNEELRAQGVKYDNLSDEHMALIAAHDDLSGRYANLSELYAGLASNTSSLRSDYEGLNATVSAFREKGGPRVALYYTTYRSGTGEDQRLILDATAYNVGDNKASRVTIKCRILYEGQPNLNEITFTNVASLDKRSYRWELLPLAQVESVWVEYA